MQEIENSQLGRFRSLVNEYFSKSELRDLCLDLNVNYDDLADERKRDLVRDLIRVMAQRNSIPLLQERCRQLRPWVDWPDIPEQEILLFLQTPERPPDLLPKERKRRQKQLVLLAKVKRLWVSGVLRDTTRDAALIDLNQTRADELLDQPWYEMVETAVYDKPALSVHKNILDTFLETGHALLILGGPGTGKTTTLLQLAQSLIQVAERNPIQPVPVILNLSSWEEKREEIGDWIVEELTVMYQIPRQIGREWLNNDDLLLLLDGLDEVSTRYRADCARAINQFRNKHGLTGMAICCRTLDYQEMGVTLRLGGAILLQTLSPEQVETYLSGAGPALAGLSQTVQQDPVLREMAQSPLMLNVMRLAYSDMSGELLRIEPEPGSGQVPEVDRRHRHLFDAYIKRMLQRSGKTSYQPDQIVRWLSWLARRMNGHNQAVFLVEQLQPSWLEHPVWTWVYTIASRLIGGVIIAYIAWFLLLRYVLEAGRLVAPFNQFTNQLPLSTSMQQLSGLLMLNLILGLVVGLIDGLHFSARRQKNEGRLDRRLGWQHLIVVALCTGGLAILILAQNNVLLMAFLVGMFEALCFVLGFGYISHGQSWRTEIRIIEALSWSWTGALKGTLLGFVLGFIAGSLIVPLSYFEIGLMIGIGFTVLFGLIGGLRHNRLDATSRPNEGMWLSARNGLYAALIIGLIQGSTITLSSLIPWSLDMQGASGLITFGLSNVFIFGLTAGLLYGFIEVIKHFGVRFLLWRNGRLPWRLVKFLDESAGIVLLHKVGGGYIFIHRLLQDHFARLNRK